MKLHLAKWYVQILLVLVICFICLMILVTWGVPYGTAFYVSMVLPAFVVILSGILGIIRLFKKQYVIGTLQILLSAGIGLSGMMFLSFHVLFYPYDHFADDLKIPQNITLNIPKDSIKHIPRTNFDFELYNGMQPGMYLWDVPVGGLENGTIYLKAFEVTQGTPLSAEGLKHDTSMHVHISKQFRTYQLAHGFTIYEGDWEHPYVARFELWYAPANGAKEKKLAEKIYKIVGWQR